MSIEQIVEESINKNPLKIKELVEAELKVRVAEIIAEMKEKSDEEDDDDDEDEDDDELEEAAKIACLKCDEVSTAAAWKKNYGFCPKCKKSTQGVAEEYSKKTKKSDDGDGMDPVGAGDEDIDNDGDSDKSDEYLKKRRKAISKDIKEASDSELFILFKDEKSAKSAADAFNGYTERDKLGVVFLAKDQKEAKALFGDISKAHKAAIKSHEID